MCTDHHNYTCKHTVTEIHTYSHSNTYVYIITKINKQSFRKSNQHTYIIHLYPYAYRRPKKTCKGSHREKRAYIQSNTNVFRIPKNDQTTIHAFKPKSITLK